MYVSKVWSDFSGGHLMFWKEISVERSSPSPSSLLPQEPSRPRRDARVEKSVSQGERQALRKARLFFRRNLGGYLFLLPALVIFALFVWDPLVLGCVMGFQKLDLIDCAVYVSWA